MSAYHIFTILGFVCLVLFVKRTILIKNTIFYFWSLFIIFSLAGSKLFVLLEPETSGWEILLNFNRGFVYFGALLGAYVAIYLYSLTEKISFLMIADNVSLVIPFAFSIGKIGCIITGCCYGVYHDSFISIIYSSENSPAPSNVPLFPIQFFELIAGLSIGIVILLFNKSKRNAGDITLLYLLLYAICRFVLEFYRGDISRGYIIDDLLSNSQLFALLVFIFALSAIGIRLCKKVGEENIR